jgi:ubiquinone biosynthesis protein
VRLACTLFFGTLATLVLARRWLGLGKRLASRSERHAAAARTLRELFERLGPTYVKLGQILSTRHDLFGEAITGELARLQDRTRATPFDIVAPLFRRELHAGFDEVFTEIDSRPIASGSVASVYRARLHDGRVVAVKVLRPRAARLIEADLGVLHFVGRALGRLPPLRLVPIGATLDIVGSCLQRQLDFRLEAASNQRLRGALRYEPSVVIPAIVEPLCSASILTMEYVQGFDRLHAGSPKALRAALRALFRMIFEEGFVHCDMHQGNMQFLNGDRVALIDFGFIAELTDRDRRLFAEFFFAIARNDGPACARITFASASFVSPNLDYGEFERAVCAIVEKAAGASAREFQVARFAVDMFSVQRSFGIVGTTAFTMAIVSLLAFEGIVKQIDPDLDFQREALPYIMPGATARRGGPAARRRRPEARQKVRT